MNQQGNSVLPRKRKSLETEAGISVKLSRCDNLHLEPHCFLQCHDSDNDPNDFSQQVWCCKFQPNSSDIVATCGGENVCVIDANSAKVKARFTKPGEEFYTLDWTAMNTGSFSSNVLACGGCLGFIFLIHVEQFCVYGFFKAHSKPVQTLNFIPNEPSLLLSAGNERKIYLWDVGMLSLPDYHFSHKKLAVFDNLEFSPLKMITLHNDFLLCASEGGLFCWYAKNVFKKEKLKHGKPQKIQEFSEIVFPFVVDEPMVDGLALIEEDFIATKCAQSGVIFLWKPSGVLHKVKAGHETIQAPTVKELKWSNTPQFYINIAACPSEKILLAGDANGSVWVYDLKAVSNGRKFSEKDYLPGKPNRASQIIPWPMCIRSGGQALPSVDEGTVMNDVCSSDDLKFVAVAADNNLVCIYKVRKEKEE